MKNYAKIRLAVFLCILLVMPSVLSVLPMTAQEVSAADTSVYWNYSFHSSNDVVLKIERGEKFYIGDYAYVWDGDDNYGCASQYNKVKYSSNKKSVLSVSSKGLVTAKKVGKATITIKYKGKKITKKFQVVKAGTFKDTSAVKGLRTRTTKISKSIPSKIGLSNGYKYLNTVKEYSDYVNNHSMEISAAGITKTATTYPGSNYTYYSSSNQLVVPQAGRYYLLEQKLYGYASKNSPTSTTCSKRLKISSVSASTKAITVKTKQSVTGNHILAANILSRNLNETLSKQSAKIYISVYDVTANKSYTGVATLKKGSKTVSVKIGSYVFNSKTGTSKFTYQNLKKGHTYRIGSDVSWGNGRTVKVK